MQQDSAVKIPIHVGLIIDGNRRWAKEHGLPKYEGHLAGYNALKDVLFELAERGVKFTSVYTFSTENWKRAEEEVSYLLNLMVRMVQADLHELIDRGIRFRHMGTKVGLPESVIKALDRAEEATKDLTKATFCACFNYGGHREIADAARKCVEDELSPDQIDEQAIADRLYAPDVPPVDLVVRSSGEQRLSNFMLWRVAYAEFYFMDKLWPAMTKADVEDIIKEYNKRQRRFGGN